MTEHTLRVREYEVDVTGAPHTEGFTTGLNRATVEPESVEVWEAFGADGPDGFEERRHVLTARVRGRHVRVAGVSDLRLTVTVTLTDDSTALIPAPSIPAPQWVRDLHAEVVASW